MLMSRKGAAYAAPLDALSNPVVAVAAHRSEQPIGRRRGRVVGERRAHQPSAAVHLEPARVGAAGKCRAVAPEPAEALAVLQRHRPGKPGLIEREISVTGHPVEKGRVVELRPVEAGDAVEFGAGEGRDAPKTRLVEAGVAEKMRTSKIRRRGKGAIG